MGGRLGINRIRYHLGDLAIRRPRAESPSPGPVDPMTGLATIEIEARTGSSAGVVILKPGEDKAGGHVERFRPGG